MNAYIKSIKKQRRAGLVRFVAGLTLVVAGCGVLLYLAEQIYKDGYNAGLKAGEEKVAQAIQDTSDELLVACEAKIDEILGQF
jgi:flagellar biosynthesis/type III secretory pathway protein FliH